MKRYECAVWDWNGTLLNDVDVNIRTINILLAKRALPPVKSRDDYLGAFRFPVIDYYRELGFDTEKESFEDIAADYIDVYEKEARDARLFDGTLEVLEALGSAGVRQVIVSAAEGERLRREVKRHGIDSYFTDILGTGDNRGDGKLQLGTRFLSEAQIPRERVIFIGDMLHDAELAHSCGCDVLLVASGHTSRDRLSRSTLPLVDGIDQVPTYIL